VRLPILLENEWDQLPETENKDKVTTVCGISVDNIKESSRKKERGRKTLTTTATANVMNKRGEERVRQSLAQSAARHAADYLSNRADLQIFLPHKISPLVLSQAVSNPLHSIFPYLISVSLINNVF
ncbi:hypothetical protein J6590_019894, partial [Homalodisca vitripennis]